MSEVDDVDPLFHMSLEEHHVVHVLIKEDKNFSESLIRHKLRILLAHVHHGHTIDDQVRPEVLVPAQNVENACLKQFERVS